MWHLLFPEVTVVCLFYGILWQASPEITRLGLYVCQGLTAHHEDWCDVMSSPLIQKSQCHEADEGHQVDPGTKWVEVVQVFGQSKRLSSFHLLSTAPHTCLIVLRRCSYPSFLIHLRSTFTVLNPLGIFVRPPRVPLTCTVSPEGLWHMCLFYFINGMNSNYCSFSFSVASSYHSLFVDRCWLLSFTTAEPVHTDLVGVCC